MSLRSALPALLAVALLTAGDAMGADRGSDGDQAGVTYLDVREGARAESLAGARVQGELPSGMRRAAKRLVRAQGPMALLERDATTGTVRMLADLGATLTGISEDGPVRTAKAYVREHLTALGLSEADLDTLQFDSAPTTSDGVTHVRWTQVIAGVPAFDNGLTVDLDRGGRILAVGGSPLHLPDPNVAVPELGADDALRVLMNQVGSRGAVSVADGPSGPRRRTTFSDGSSAELVHFDVNGRLRLAWRIEHRASSVEHYDAVIDAVSGRLLRRANFVKFAVNAQVFPHYPGADVGGAQLTRDLADPAYGYLADAATTLSGPFARAFTDVNDNNTAQPGEEVNPSTADSTFDTSWATNAPGGCGLTGPMCSWDAVLADSWENNREQNAIQTFWFVNRFRDHLARTPIGFTGFQDVDRVVVHTDDGADTDAGFPDDDHVNNANMSTLPEGSSPRMQMYLFYKGSGSPFRDINGGDSAEIVYHEYTHGLSNRLVTDNDGVGALNSAQSAAMGEGWSDWYAMDLLARPDTDNLDEIYVPDTATPGEVDLGDYTDASPNRIRSQPVDCPVDAAPSACPGDGSAGTGGYTYGDFGQVCGCGPEEHSDGEIWAETLWDLRTRLIADLGDVALGSDKAEQVITRGMDMAPAEPSFLDVRNAMLAEAVALGDADLEDAIWDVFTERGMGFFAGSAGSDDIAPAESFVPVPIAGGDPGSVTGTITDALTGSPIAGAVVSLGSQSTSEATSAFRGVTGPNGAYSLGPVPQGVYGKVFVSGASGHDPKVIVDLAVGAQTTLNTTLVRNWAATAGGGAIESTTDDTGASFGCGAAAIINQLQSIGWSPWNPASDRGDFPAELAGTTPTATIALPRPVDVSAFAVDPGATCGDDASATARQFTIETSPDGANFTTAVDGTGADAFVPSDAGTLKPLSPVPGTGNGVRFVRLKLLSPQGTCADCSGRHFIDLSELAVRGNGLPTGGLSVPATGTAGQAVTLDASSFTDDGTISGYAWDFEGDGSFDATTTTATATHTYSAAGNYAPRVRVTDNTAGTAAASAAISVAAAAPPVVAPVLVKPRITLPRRQRANRATVRVRCQTACTGTVRLRLAKKLTRRLRLKSRIVGRRKPALKAGTTTVRVPISKLALRKLRNRKIRRVTLGVAVRVKDTRGLVSSLSRTRRVAISRR